MEARKRSCVRVGIGDAQRRATVLSALTEVMRGVHSDAVPEPTSISEEDRRLSDEAMAADCQKRSIAGITAKIVADHDHHTGNIGDFICDSCDTGPGRFKNGENLLKNAIFYLRERDGL